MARKVAAGGSGHTRKHSQSNKHGHHKPSAKHNPQHHQPNPGKTSGPPVLVVAHNTQHAKPRGYTLGEFAICVPEAIAASLFLATGYKATENDLLTLYFATGSPEYGIPIEQGLSVARQIGLAGYKPIKYSITDKLKTGNIAGTTIPQGSHAVTLGNDGVYSWGEERNMIFSPEEIWKISWA